MKLATQKRSRRIGVIATTLLLTGVAVVSPEAQAGGFGGWDSCPEGWVCAWEDAEYSGYRADFNGDFDNFKNVKVSGTACDRYGDMIRDHFNDCATSVRSRVNHDVCFYWDAGMKGERYVVKANSYATHVGAHWNDKWSSFQASC
ncbi:peptidase inhibitor family I36 protein [Kibdelosporangium philippinense]|uniref:peptidase inhibitor family I36 protein n=1 Tax=Kibdelosporangium philippinense TaxID=211113 RepID=UPI0035EAA9A1